MPSPTPLPPEVVAAIQSGHTIEAIKLLRERTGLGLTEAKQAVDHYVLSQATPREARAAGTSLPPAAIQALQSGNKIEAIRLVREHSGLGLAEAKYLVDSHSATTEPSSSVSLSPGSQSQQRSTSFLWIAILLAVVAYLIYRFLVVS